MPPFLPTLLMACTSVSTAPPTREGPAPALAPPAAPDALLLQRPVPEGFVDLRTLDGLSFSVGFHRSDNPTGAPLPGYGAPGAWLHEDAAAALEQVQRDLEIEGLGLLVHDAYRPQRASAALAAWTRRTNQEHLLEDRYLEERSVQNHGTAVEVSLVDARTGARMDMGTAWNTFSSRSNMKYAKWPASHNRSMLWEAMRERGFKGTEQTWWHYHMTIDHSRPRDVPYGCFEPDEGAFVVPIGWDQPGWRAQTGGDRARCPADQTK